MLDLVEAAIQRDLGVISNIYERIYYSICMPIILSCMKIVSHSLSIFGILSILGILDLVEAAIQRDLGVNSIMYKLIYGFICIPVILNRIKIVYQDLLTYLLEPHISGLFLFRGCWTLWKQRFSATSG